MAMSLASMMMFSVFSRHGSDYKCATGYTGALKKNWSEWQRDYFGLLHFNDWKLLVALDCFYYETYHLLFLFAHPSELWQRRTLVYCRDQRKPSHAWYQELVGAQSFGSEVWSSIVQPIGSQDLRSEVAPWSRTAATRCSGELTNGCVWK